MGCHASLKSHRSSKPRRGGLQSLPAPFIDRRGITPSSLTRNIVRARENPEAWFIHRSEVGSLRVHVYHAGNKEKREAGHAVLTCSVDLGAGRHCRS